VNILFLYPPNLAGIIRAYFPYPQTDFRTTPTERIDQIRNSHNFFKISLSPPLDFSVHPAFSEAFYNHCAKRLSSRSVENVPDETVAMAAMLVPRCFDLSQTLREMLTHLPSGPGQSEAWLEIELLWKRLERVIYTAFPEIGANASDDVSKANRWWDVLEEVLRHSPLPNILATQAELVFIPGEYPAKVNYALMMAAKLRPLMPKTKFIPWYSKSTLYSSFAHIKSQLLEREELFRTLDAFPVYTDLSDHTFCETVETYHRKGSFDEVENLIFSETKGVRFNEPSARTTSEFLESSSLGRNLSFQLFGEPQQVAVEGLQKTALIDPSPQKCHWNRCAFCATAAQKGVNTDPHLARRAEETVDLLLKLQREGTIFTFIGFDAVPPSMTKQIVGRLESMISPPIWGLETRLEPDFEPSFIRSMARAGCRGIIFGLESNDRINRLMNKYSSGMDQDWITRTIGEFDSNGIAVHANTIYNIPGATLDDFNEYRDWLTSTFDRYKLFSFNTNPFSLLSGAPMARFPERFGLTLRNTERLDDTIHFDTERPIEIELDKWRDIWRKVIGLSEYKGVIVGDVHSLYHETLGLRFLDAAFTRSNLFKKMKSRLRYLDHIADRKVSFTHGVQICAAKKYGKWTWLVNPDVAHWTRVDSGLCEAIEMSREKNLSFGKVIATLSPEKQRQWLAQLVDLIGNELVESYVCEGD
jgi:hypothetical protein